MDDHPNPASEALAGLKTVRSRCDYVTTRDRLLQAFSDHGLIVFSRIDHAASANTAGLSLRPTEVFLVGNPRIGTPLMNEHPTLAIDLPLKVLLWEDKSGAIYLAYNAPA